MGTNAASVVKRVCKGRGCQRDRPPGLAVLSPATASGSRERACEDELADSGRVLGRPLPGW